MRAALLAFALLAFAGSSAAASPTPTPLSAEALLAAVVPASTVQQVAGGSWWPKLPSFDTTVFQSDPQPMVTTGLTFEQLGGSATITTTLYAFDSTAKSLQFLLAAELVGPQVDEKNPSVGDRRAYYTTTLEGGQPATRLYFTRGRVGVAVVIDGQHWSASKVASIAKPIDLGVQGLLAGTLEPPSIPPADLAHLPSAGAAPGTLLGTASLSDEAWATVDRDATPARVRAGLAARGAKLLFRRYLRSGSGTDVIETTLFAFPKASDATAWFGPFKTGVESGTGSLDPGKTGAHSAFRQGHDNYELRFAAGKYVGDVFCYAPYAPDPSPACAAAVRTTAERWFAQLSRTE